MNSKLFTKIDKNSLFSTEDKTTNRNSVTQQINLVRDLYKRQIIKAIKT